MQPRTSRRSALHSASELQKSVYQTSKRAKWLADKRFSHSNTSVDWKRQYRIRHNWSRGSARVKESQLVEKVTAPPLLIRLKGDYVFVADATQGLKVCSVTREPGLIDTISLKASNPTSLAVDTLDPHLGQTTLSVGYADGSFELYSFLSDEGHFVLRFAHPAASSTARLDKTISRAAGVAIAAIAQAHPFLLTLDKQSLLSVYRLDDAIHDRSKETIRPPMLASCMKSHTASTPLCLSLRKSAQIHVASVAYPLPHWNGVWSVGLQEFRISPDGVVVESRMATALSDDCQSALQCIVTLPSLIPASHAVTSLSYSHPYLLTSHENNTLALRLVKSSARELTIGPEQCLWGHTASVSGAHVSDRGKAVSISSLGNDLRVWDLEATLSSEQQPRGFRNYLSVRVQEQEHRHRRKEESLNPHETLYNHTSNQIEGWISFDEEKVVLLKGQNDGPRALVTYDFT